MSSQNKNLTFPKTVYVTKDTDDSDILIAARTVAEAAANAQIEDGVVEEVGVYALVYTAKVTRKAQIVR